MASEATSVAGSSENSIWKIMFHEGNWESACGTVVEGQGWCVKAES